MVHPSPPPSLPVAHAHSGNSGFGIPVSRRFPDHTHGPGKGGSALPVIGGSGARVPTQFLDGQGGFQSSKAIPEARYVHSGQPVPTIDLVTQGSENSRRHSQPNGNTSNTIDLTGDDDDDDDDDDEPVLVGSKSADSGDVVVDEQRSNALVCMGLIHAVVLCMYGLPEPLTFKGNYDSEPPEDPAYQKSNWPMATSFWSEKGYRPVLLTTDPPQAHARLLPNSWLLGNGGQKPQEIKVSVVLPPLAAYPTLTPDQARNIPPKIMSPFGSLGEKYNTVLEPLLQRKLIRCEARCRVASLGRSNNFLHQVELLVFARRPDMALISERLSSGGIQLDRPSAFNPSDYPGQPEYSNPHNPPAGGYQSRSYHGSIYHGSGFGTVLQTKEMTDQERKKQVDSVYASLRSGDDLEMIEPGKLIRTKLFPHQKQALSFLLAREKERSFDEAPAAKQGDDHKPSMDGADSKGKAKEEDLDAGTVSLWKAVRSSNGRIRYYTNVVTQADSYERPTICRGAILADDMGLGKTITVISLIALTLADARAFGQSDLVPHDRQSKVHTTSGLSKKGDQDDDSDEGISVSVFGAPPPAKKARGSAKGKKGTKARKAIEAIRRKHLEIRSRATLIVCPLSVVSNWEDQIKEHWSSQSQPSIYVYHGPSRLTNTIALADYDIVLTTYSTLGTEFANQRTWVEDSKGGPDGKASEQNSDNSSEDDDGIMLVDGNGIPLEESSKKKKAKRKRKFDPAREAPNTLQRIEWFRIVLDEAHVIKEASTWQSRAVCNLSAERRISLTGTPIQNRMDDLYSQIKFLRLDPFTDRSVWNLYCGHKEKPNTLLRAKKAQANNSEPLDTMALARVQTIMKFLTLRRTKETKMPSGKPILSLPPKYSRVMMLDFEESEKAKYQTLHSRYKEDFEEMMQQDTVTANYATILHEILNLRLSCDHPSLVDVSKDARRKMGGGQGDLSAAITLDGLSRERAVELFNIFSESEMAICTECQLDLSRCFGGERGSALGADELEGALRAVEDRPPKGKTSVGKCGGTTPSTSKSGGSASATGVHSPIDAGSSNVRPIVTRCQHFFCSSCFRNRINVPGLPEMWPPKSQDVASCPSCNFSLHLAVDAVQIEEADLDDREAVEDSNAESDKEDFDWDDYLSGYRKPKAEGSEGSVPSLSSSSARKVEKTSAELASLHGRTDLSSKIRALLLDLIPFSKCNPYSRLFDPDAPRLEQVATVQEAGKPKPTEPVVVIQQAPSNLKSGLMKSDEGIDQEEYLPIKSVVFSQWTRMLDRIEKSLKKTGIKSVRLDGSMRRNERGVALDRFKSEPDVEVLLVSLRAGGFGLNLVTACRAYLMDPYWNPAVENQGLDRVHRMGQLRPVITTKYIMKHSIEENMVSLSPSLTLFQSNQELIPPQNVRMPKKN
ncbi:hypothetical protein IE53DRAFT_311733 [Violaceomyces palustris]|uniref:Uncharacterized protein n=1 Tax=Violaceomyces palustris TaxID=1673888 RepID=A0ACD0P3E2_9BASI|nr:hypothetical protein IE53DRAFT_311733 [Violaceomyces palustris]